MVVGVSRVTDLPSVNGTCAKVATDDDDDDDDGDDDVDDDDADDGTRSLGRCSGALEDATDNVYC